MLRARRSAAPRRRGHLISGVAATACLGLVLPACVEDSSHLVFPDAGPATSARTDERDERQPRTTPDALASPQDVSGAGGEDVADPTDAVDAVDPRDRADVGPAFDPDRAWSHRILGGMSMGAASITIALHHPDAFDVVGALGGYADASYMMTLMHRMHLSGFCPLPDLEANLEAIDLLDADPAVDCGPAPARFELELPQHFNQLYFDDNGVDMHREFYGEAIQTFTMLYGNLGSAAHDDTPYLPRGLDLAWWKSAVGPERCVDPPPIPQAASFNAEYNPEGLYPVIPFCDGREQVTEGLPANAFDPAAAHLWPMDVLLAVDLNANGERDLGEPLFLNPFERYQDVGLDGCSDAREDGAGGCLPDGAADATAADPNGDDYHWWDNPQGAEDNTQHDAGEPFSDLGLDGVAATGDEGEGNGTWDAVSGYQLVLDNDADTLIRAVDPSKLERMDFWFDAGRRDALHAAVATRNIVGALRARGLTIERYYGYAGADRPGMLAPDILPGDFAGSAHLVDTSPQAIGRHLYVEYGDPDATPAQIAAGDGKHVGTLADAVDRLLAFVVFALARVPDPDIDGGYDLPITLVDIEHFYSEGLKARRDYTIALPPGYAEHPDARYPVLYFMHGLGQSSADLAPAAFLTAAMMAEGKVAKAIIVFPNGACCRQNIETGERECACRSGPSGTKLCVDPTCTGPMETCEERAIPSHLLVPECNEGSLYGNLSANRWGEARDDLRYEDSVLDLVRHVDLSFRTRSTSVAR